MYTYTHTHIKHFSMPLENFILIKRRRGIIIAQNRNPALRIARNYFAACNKQFSAPQAISIAKRPHLIACLR